MTPPRRPSTGTRRDGGVKRINTNEVRYPTMERPNPEDAEYEQWKADGGRRPLRPARDTGLALDSRGSRERRRTRRKQGGRVFVIALVVLALGAVGLGWRYASDLRAAEAPVQSNDSAASTRAPLDDGAAIMKAARTEQAPTPVFATYEDIELRLPVQTTALTEIGFHQAAYAYALHLKTAMPDADMTKAKAEKTTHRDLSAQQQGEDSVLTGSVLRMWRSRPGKPDSAVDIGAPAGSDVLAPITGTVVKVKSYDLYGRYPDYEIHIIPDGVSWIDCVLIHVDDVSVEPGDRVVAGVTRLAAVRHLSDRIHHQLGDYTEGGGDHTHIQLNNAKHEQYKGLEGAVSVGGS